ncbi:Fur family transcriptional regulator [Anaeromassilibacillus senegalensis]|uniref:Fur family transcriptional regulator n=1 Tax=Anaeromassilibacillus senegalensis TaxID=1673717 RepID=UPI0006814B36|nr:transcriptional repressor [Anaeromassilibacillus senegalensis]
MEKRQNFSRKREAILATIRGTKVHPTAEWVYQQLKPAYPDLSLGTVYRNISQFKNDGVIISVGVVNGQERFDGDLKPHTHFICTSCGAVIDIPGEFISQRVNKQVAQEHGLQVESNEVIFRGTCSECLQRH